MKKKQSTLPPGRFLKVLISAIVLLLLLAGFGAAYFLSRDNQDLRNQAFTCVAEQGACGEFGTVCCPGLICDGTPNSQVRTCVKYAPGSEEAPIPAQDLPAPAQNNLPS